MKMRKGMDVKVFAKKAIGGIEAASWKSTQDLPTC